MSPLSDEPAGYVAASDWILSDFWWWGKFIGRPAVRAEKVSSEKNMIFHEKVFFTCQSDERRHRHKDEGFRESTIFCHFNENQEEIIFSGGLL